MVDFMAVTGSDLAKSGEKELTTNTLILVISNKIYIAILVQRWHYLCYLLINNVLSTDFLSRRAILNCVQRREQPGFQPDNQNYIFTIWVPNKSQLNQTLELVEWCLIALSFKWVLPMLIG